jgi:rod shape determining protein RodA
MNLGLLPVIGISLPFVSYGGSALVTSLGMTGIILNIALRSKQAIKY